MELRRAEQGAAMNNIFDEEAIESGFGDVDLQAMAKRQLVASVAVAAVIGVAVIFMAMAPASHNYADVAIQKSSAVQQPRFVSKAIDSVAEAKPLRQIELP
jgi:hypothetical protein